MDALSALSFLGLLISFIWLAYTALNLYKSGQPRELYSLYMNTSGLFYLFMVAAWVLMFAFASTNGFANMASWFGFSSLITLIPFIFIISIGFASAFASKNADKVGFLMLAGTFIWQVSSALSSEYEWAMFALGIGYFLAAAIMLFGGNLFGGVLATLYPDAEKKMREWLQSADANDTYGQSNAIWKGYAKAMPAQYALAVEQQKSSYPPRVQAVQIIIFSAWSMLYAAAAEFAAADPSILAQISKDPAPFIFGPFFGLIIIFFASMLIYGILGWRQSKQMEILLDKKEFAIKEPITGSIHLKFGKDKQARSLMVGFYGERQESKKHSIRFCEIETKLSGARTYLKGESIPFSIAMPQDVESKLRPRAPANEMEKFIRRYEGLPVWRITAKLDIPNEIDISQEVEVKIASGKES